MLTAPMHFGHRNSFESARQLPGSVAQLDLPTWLKAWPPAALLLADKNIGDDDGLHRQE